MNKNNKFSMNLGIILSSLLIAAPVFAYHGNSTIVDRYLITPNKPLVQQKDLMRQVNQVVFPPEVKTVQAAIKYWLSFSGYYMMPLSMMDKSVRAMMQSPLPQIDRNFGPMSLQDGLETLVGKPFMLVIDRVHRLVSFQLKPKYTHLYKKHKARPKPKPIPKPDIGTKIKSFFSKNF
jgi:conjugative transfer region protein (TIGR03748 family)